ncbi:MAG: thioredoxin-dependent thiol peroxidase [Magnetococcales bacterium]|nr:thioredoxin-dependent thiol peroxidase [Magnetococcales bacterium]
MLLDVGSTIPDLTLPDQTGEQKRLLDLLGEKGAVFYFYPKDSTPGCTTEGRDFQSLLNDFNKEGFTVIGISKDSVKRHANFCEKQGFSFSLISDTDGEMCEAFGVWQEKKNYGKTYMGIVRSTFIVNAQGTVCHVFAKVRVKEHAQKVLENIRSGIC